MKDINVYIYTEYTGSLKSGTGKYHFILESYVKTKTGEKPATLKDCAICEDITRNKLELLAVKNALSRITEKSRVTIYTSSEYITGIIAMHCLEKWNVSGYRTKGKPVKHADLWKSIAAYMEQHDITFIKSASTSYSKAQAIELRNYQKKAGQN